jgi:hypothetical protein
MPPQKTVCRLCTDCLFAAIHTVHTTHSVAEKLERTAQHNDLYGRGVRLILQIGDAIRLHTVRHEGVEFSRVEQGRGHMRPTGTGTEPLLANDHRALRELQTLTGGRVVISSVILKVLVTRGLIKQEEALDRLDKMMEGRD